MPGCGRHRSGPHAPADPQCRRVTSANAAPARVAVRTHHPRAGVLGVGAAARRSPRSGEEAGCGGGVVGLFGAEVGGEEGFLPVALARAAVASGRRKPDPARPIPVAGARHAVRGRLRPRHIARPAGAPSYAQRAGPGRPARRCPGRVPARPSASAPWPRCRGRLPSPGGAAGRAGGRGEFTRRGTRPPASGGPVRCCVPRRTTGVRRAWSAAR